MYTLEFTVEDWHEGIKAKEGNPKIYGINCENLADQIRIYLDLEENVSYTLDFKSAGTKWYRLMAKGDGYLFYTLQAEDMKRRSFNIQLVATYADGTVKKTPIYKGYDILASINATDSAGDKDASSFKEALMELAKWTKGEKGDKGDKGDKGEKGDKGDTPIKGVDYFTDADIEEITDKAKADVDGMVQAVDKRVDVLKQELTAEGASRKASDESLKSEIEAETAERKSADSALETLITTETADRKTADSTLESKLTAETDAREKADSDLLSKISEIPKFAIKVVDTLPTTDISDTTVYLLKTSETETGNLYTEYIHVDGAWEELGTQDVDLSDYYQKEEVDSALAKKAEVKHEHKVSDISDYSPYDDTEVRGLITAEATARSEADSKKVGHQEVQGNTLYMYSDDTKAVLLATLDLPTAPVQDVQVNGTSVLSDGIANVPIATESSYGIIKSGGYGIAVNTVGNLYITGLTKSQYDSASNEFGISKKTLENIKQSYVDDILCSTDETQALTTAQKISARERIGVRHEQLIEKIVIEDETTSTISRYAEPNGEPYSFAEFSLYYHIPSDGDTLSVVFGLEFQYSGIKKRSKNTTKNQYSGVYWDGALFGVYSNATTNGYITKGIDIYPEVDGLVENDIVNGFTIQPRVTGNYLPKGTEIYIYGIRA